MYHAILVTRNFARFQEHIAHALNERIAQFVDALEQRPAVNSHRKLALCKFIVKTFWCKPLTKTKSLIRNTRHRLAVSHITVHLHRNGNMHLRKT